jgi:hypothetical protein
MQHTWIATLIVLSTTLLLSVGCQPVRPVISQAEPRTAEEIVLAAADGWNEEEVTVSAIDATVAHFADDAVYEIAGLPTGTETYTGRDEIYAWMAGLLEGDFRLTVEILESDDTTVLTETRTWMNWSREAGIAPLVATEEYVVEDGKITRVTWTLTQESLEQLMKVMGEQ